MQLSEFLKRTVPVRQGRLWPPHWVQIGMEDHEVFWDALKPLGGGFAGAIVLLPYIVTLIDFRHQPSIMFWILNGLFLLGMPVAFLWFFGLPNIQGRIRQHDFDNERSRDLERRYHRFLRGHYQAPDGLDGFIYFGIPRGIKGELPLKVTGSLDFCNTVIRMMRDLELHVPHVHRTMLRLMPQLQQVRPTPEREADASGRIGSDPNNYRRFVWVCLHELGHNVDHDISGSPYSSERSANAYADSFMRLLGL